MPGRICTVGQGQILQLWSGLQLQYLSQVPAKSEHKQQPWGFKKGPGPGRPNRSLISKCLLRPRCERRREHLRKSLPSTKADHLSTEGAFMTFKSKAQLELRKWSKKSIQTPSLSPCRRL